MRVFVLIIILISGCQINEAYRLSEDEKLVHVLLSKIAKKLKNEMGLIPCGNAAQMMDQIKMLGLSFDYFYPVDIDTAREFLVEAVEKFAHEVNSDESLRPYLNNYPFEPKNILIEIYVKTREWKDFGSGELCIVVASEGVLKYKIHDPENGRLKTIYRETFEEALQKVNRVKEKSG